MEQLEYDYDTALESLSPKRLKKGLSRMLMLTLELQVETGIDVEFSSKFFSDIQILFDFLDDLKEIRKEAKKTKE